MEPNPDDLLFASRDLALLYLPPGFASPSLHYPPGANALSWYWHCDLIFLSWMNGVAQKHAALLTPAQIHAIDFIRCHVCVRNGINDDNWPELLPPPGAKLPTETLDDSVRLCDSYLGPAWDGIAEHARHIGYADPLRAEAFDPPAYAKILRDQAYFAKPKKKAKQT